MANTGACAKPYIWWISHKPPLDTGGKGMLTEKIKDQIFAVRDSGAANYGE